MLRDKEHKMTENMQLTESMESALRSLYYHYKFTEPFVPQEGRGIHPTRSTKALVRRGLAKEVRDGHYVITKSGVDYVHQSLSIPMVSTQTPDTNPYLARAKHVFQDFVSRRDLGLWAGYFHKRAQALNEKAVSNWDKGGWIEDQKTHNLAQVYEYLTLLAWEHLDEQTAS
jgi:hypothetical protein